MQDLLASEGVVRVRVEPDAVATASARLARLTAPDRVTPSSMEPGWISVQIAPDRASEVNRSLAEAGIYASGLSSGNDLEELFLALTGPAAASDPDGTFAGIDPSAGRMAPSEVLA